LLFFLLTIGVAVLIVISWVRVIGSQELATGLLQANPWYIFPSIVITLFYLLARFFRWQFLLRREGSRLPTRPSLAIYLASLVGIATPAYLGEFFLRSVLLRRKFKQPISRTIIPMLMERLLDFAALGVIGFFTASTWWGALVALAFGVIALAMGGLANILLPRIGYSWSGFESLFSRQVIFQALGISLAVWIPPTLLVNLSAASLGVELSPLVGMNIYSLATLLGGLTLAPAGFGVTGSILILLLEQSQVTIPSSILAVTLVRTTSMAVVLILGSIFLFQLWKPVSQAGSSDLHFDQIAADYRAQFSDHVWQHLFQKKGHKLRQALCDAGIRQGTGLDLGCGLGLQCQAISQESYSIFGIDMAFNLLRHARQIGVSAVQADALQLPYPDQSLDFVYTIGVLHHLPGADLQVRVIDEVSRILKPGGVFIIHETNPHNPLFRFYMGYLFPILRSIDEGTEYWITPETWQGLQSLRFVELQYFTFIPDFLPQTITARLLSLEKRLEGSRFRPFSVHYMAVLQKDG
jgi:ubiquinone/menaquinone biosynthesis C-methylase UbiE/uncharacterized membrane protein YbhN (UPF0104 family)